MSFRFRCCLALAMGVACSTTRSPLQTERELALSLAAIDPNSEPAPPQVPPSSGRPEFNTEYWLGSEAEEARQFKQFSGQIQMLQLAAAREHGQPLQRGFHAKAHGCLSGTLSLDPNRPERARYGVFADTPTDRTIAVRFSNGVGWRQGDSELDARGMAVKVFDVPGPHYIDDGSNTQDFLMTNSPTPVGRDAQEFMKFAHANADGRIAGLFFLITHPSSGAPALLRTGAIESAVTSTYWSGSAYHLGAAQAIKFAAKPCDPALKRSAEKSSPDYLAADLKEAASRSICMGIYVQFQSDPEQTPIENASKEWTEQLAPMVRVATVNLPPQELWEAKRCDELSFSPWHSIAAHKPMGHINRARRYVYDASARLRR